MLLARLLACGQDVPPALTSDAPEAPCAGLWGGVSHLEPYDVAVDSTRRRAWNIGYSTPSLVEIDLDDGALLDAFPISDVALASPTIAADADGFVWVTQTRAPALLRVDPDRAEARDVEVGLDAAAEVLANADGGVFVVGLVDGVPTLLSLSGAGLVTAQVAVEGLGCLFWAGDRVAVCERDHVSLRDPVDLSAADTCTLPFPASAGAWLPDGTIVVADEALVGLAGCDGGDAVSWDAGLDNGDVVVVGDRAWVLDRLGPEDPNQSVARPVDAAGVGEPVATSRHGAFGAADGDLLWLNSQATAEVWAMDPSTGAVTFATRTGAFIDGLAPDLADGTLLYATGRLSDTVARLRSSRETATSHDVRWPYSPVLDDARGLLWVLSQTDALVVGLDAETLETVATIDLGVGPNGLLAFGSLALDAETGHLWAAETASDHLFELDPDAGVVLAELDLGGPVPEDETVIGELRVRADGGVAHVSRSWDGRLQRVEGGAVETTWLSDSERTRIEGRGRLELLQVGDGTAWFGGFAFDADTLARAEDRDLDVAKLVGRAADGGWVGLSLDEGALVWLGEAGEVVEERPAVGARENAAVVAVGPADQAWLSDARAATVCPVSPTTE